MSLKLWRMLLMFRDKLACFKSHSSTLSGFRHRSRHLHHYGYWCGFNCSINNNFADATRQIIDYCAVGLIVRHKEVPYKYHL